MAPKCVCVHRLAKLTSSEICFNCVYLGVKTCEFLFVILTELSHPQEIPIPSVDFTLFCTYILKLQYWNKKKKRYIYNLQLKVMMVCSVCVGANRTARLSS